MSDHEARIAQLESEGWKRQFTANEPRLSEAVELYEETGCEVHLEPLVVTSDSDGSDGDGVQCNSCYEGAEDQYKIIFIRKKAAGATLHDDLYP